MIIVAYDIAKGSTSEYKELDEYIEENYGPCRKPLNTTWLISGASDKREVVQDLEDYLGSRGKIVAVSFGPAEIVFSDTIDEEIYNWSRNGGWGK